ncbi:MAG: hypothetical protein AAGH68_01450 [Pseudomonadota bacterium]
MTDVLKIALDRRAELHDELAKLDDFIRMAESLIRQSQKRAMEMDNDSEEETLTQQRPARVPEPVVRQQARRGPGEDETSGANRPQVIRRASGVSGV